MAQVLLAWTPRAKEDTSDDTHNGNTNHGATNKSSSTHWRCEVLRTAWLGEGSWDMLTRRPGRGDLLGGAMGSPQLAA